METGLGPVMLDLQGPELLVEEREVLRHPAAGGVILFTRNYADPKQLEILVAEIHAVREPPLLVAVDHEGGRVQRFRAGFTPLPPCAVFGDFYDREPAEAVREARECGWLMAAELRALGVDLSFAPVLDLETGLSDVIRDRAFHREPEAIVRLAGAYVEGMHEAGMAAVGKHFPGHGSVAGDSHHELPVDERPYAAIRSRDLVPFEGLIKAGLPGIMPAHVVYPAVDAQPAGFSRTWLQEVLRGRLGFEGCIFSDDLGMAGAEAGGSFADRGWLALEAGCDMLLVCNRPEGARELIDALGTRPRPLVQARICRMYARNDPGARVVEDGARRMRNAQSIAARWAARAVRPA